MKKPWGYHRPYSYRNAMLSLLLACLLFAAAVSFVMSYAVSLRDVSDELETAQLQLMQTMTELQAMADLTPEQLCEAVSVGGVTVVPADDEELPQEVTEGLLQSGQCILRSNKLSVPEGWLLLGDHIYRLTVSDTVSVGKTSALRIIFAFLFFGMSAVLVCLAFTRYMSRPVIQLTRATRMITQGDFSVRIPADEYSGEISELIRAFNEMAGELEKTDSLQRDFISGISHEFKTPIASIKGYARLLQMEGITEADRAEYVQIIASESDRLARMSQTLLRLSSLEQQTAPASRTEFRLDEQLRQVIVSMAPVWEDRDIEWDLSLDPVTVLGDEELLRQVWINLIQNALKFSETGSSLGITVSQKDQEAIVAVRDHGIGMDEETQKRIFDKFFQADRSHSGEGIGLGLSLCRRIVMISGGTIAVSSTPGEGSTFTVRLPLSGVPLSQ